MTIKITLKILHLDECTVGVSDEKKLRWCSINAVKPIIPEWGDMPFDLDVLNVI